MLGDSRLGFNKGDGVTVGRGVKVGSIVVVEKVRTPCPTPPSRRAMGVVVDVDKGSGVVVGSGDVVDVSVGVWVEVGSGVEVSVGDAVGVVVGLGDTVGVVVGLGDAVGVAVDVSVEVWIVWLFCVTGRQVGCIPFGISNRFS